MNSITLTIAGGPVAGRTKRVDPGQKLMVGRAGSSDFAVMDLRMSREHLQVFFRSGDWHVRDCQSSHGTMVNGKRVDEIMLREGDIIEAGDTKFQVTCSDSELRVDDHELRVDDHELRVDDHSAVPQPARSRGPSEA